MLCQITSACVLYEQPKYVMSKCNSEVTRTLLTWFMSAGLSKKPWRLTRGVIFGSSTPVEPMCKIEVLCLCFLTEFMIKKKVAFQFKRGKGVNRFWFSPSLLGDVAHLGRPMNKT